MNTFMLLLLWSVLQVTLVAVITAAAYLLARRRGASLRSTLVLTGLLTATLLIPLLWLPWPRWELPRATEVNAKHEPTIDDVSKNARSTAPPSTTITSSNDPSQNIEIEPVTWRTHWNNFIDALDNPRSASPPSPASPASPASPTPASRFPWERLVLALFTLALATALARLAGGYWSLRRTIRAARPLRDAHLLEQIHHISDDLGLKTTIALRETHKTATAATTGWRKPVILLPVGWRNWTTSQTRAVLAHELAHVVRRDSLTGGMAQLALALHFYHPLWHWLVARLRLEQELAADALAASITGGRDVYLKNLAALALRRSEQPLAWPARAFLPSRHTFLRRIEMLRDPNRVVDRSSRMLRTMSVVGLLIFGLLISGIRPGVVAAQNEPTEKAVQQQAEETDIASETANASSLDKSQEPVPDVSAYIPADAVLVVTIRPKRLFNDPQVKPYSEQANELFTKLNDPLSKTMRTIGFDVRNIEEVAFGINFKSGPPSMAIRFASEIDAGKIGKAAIKTTTTLAGTLVYQMSDQSYLAIPSRRTLIWSPSSASVSAGYLSGALNTSSSPWPRIGEKLDNSVVTVRADTEAVLVEIRKASQAGAKEAEILAPLLPTLELTQLAGLGMTLGDEQTLMGFISCIENVEQDEATKQVGETLRSLIGFGQNTIRQLQQQQIDSKESDSRGIGALLSAGETLLDSAEVESNNGVVHLTATAGDKELSKLIVSQFLQASQAAVRLQSKNNLKKIALAFHNYHDVYTHFPPAVIENNGVKHSWRVAILPFVGAGDLYEQYHQDEPWNSESNQEILAQIPNVFRDPQDDSAPTCSSYYLLTSEHAVTNSRPAEGMMAGIGAPAGAGETQEDNDRPKAKFHTLFTDEPINIRKEEKGPAIRNVTDGTSNTIMVVEASRDVPWTKPEDIPFDPEKLDELLKEDLDGNHAGGFQAAFCDGAVRLIPNQIDTTMLSRLITPADGHPVGNFDAPPKQGGQ